MVYLRQAGWFWWFSDGVLPLTAASWLARNGTISPGPPSISCHSWPVLTMIERIGLPPDKPTVPATMPADANAWHLDVLKDVLLSISNQARYFLFLTAIRGSQG